MVNGSVSIYLIGQGRSASDLQNLIICKVEMKVAGSIGNGCQKRVELIFIDLRAVTSLSSQATAITKSR